MDRQLFERIFSDAHVIDVDLSEWDKSIDIYVLADHMPQVEGGRLPLFRVKFVGARALVLEGAAASGLGLAADEHVQWTLDDFRIDETAAEIRISLWGFEASPRLEITCQDVEISPFDLRVLDDLFPGWDRPSAGLARPGPAKLMELRGSGQVEL